MVYSGNKVSNSNNIFFIVFLILYCYLQFTDLHSKYLFPVTFTTIVFFIVMVYQAFYFETTADELIVRNYTLPFMVFHYNLSAITMIQLNGTSYRSAAGVGLKVIQNNKRTIDFRSVSLQVDDWQNLVNVLSNKKIAIEINAITLKDKIGIPED